VLHGAAVVSLCEDSKIPGKEGLEECFCLASAVDFPCGLGSVLEWSEVSGYQVDTAVGNERMPLDLVGFDVGV